MTLLGAVLGDGCALIGADSLKRYPRENYGTTTEKLGPLPNENVVWGCYGAGEAIAEFQTEIAAHSQFVTWANVEYSLRNPAERLERKYFLDGGLGVLFAGVLDDEWRIVAFGDSLYRRTDDWCFLGNGRTAATVGWLVAQASAASLEDQFRLAMTVVVDACHPDLLPPVHLWKVTHAGCEHVQVVV